MFKAWKVASGINRARLGLVLLAALIGLSGGTTNYFLWYHIPIPPFGNIGVSVYALIVAYTILRYRLLEINLVIKRGIIFAIVYVFVLGIPFGTVAWMQKELGIDALRFWWVPLLMSVVLASGGPFIYLWLRARAEQKIIQERFKRLEALKVASGYMVRITGLETLLRAIVHRLVKILRVTHSAIYLWDEKKKFFEVKSRWALAGEFLKLTEKISADFFLIQLLLNKKFSSRREPLERDAIPHRIARWGFTEKEMPQLEQELEILGANVLIPGYEAGGGLFGFLVLGRTLSGRPLETEELQELTLFANQAVSAIKNTETVKQLEEYHRHMGHAEKLASMGRLMSSLIHDINNPLTVVCGNAQMLALRWEGKLGQDDIKKIRQIDECGRRAAAILQRLLKFSKPAGEEMVPLEVDQVIQNTFELAHGQISFEHIEALLDLKANCEILGNEMQLEEVLWNLMNNAWQAMGGKGKIQISTKLTDSKVKIIVEDNGPGMPAEIVEKIFEPFYTTKKEGTGLGLYITHLIVLAHRGEIRCQSEVGKGTQFIIDLPLYEGRRTRGLWRKPR